jgi:hypothetical protein
MTLATAARRRLPQFLTVLLAVISLLEGIASAGIGDHVPLPRSGKRIRNRATMDLESHWVSGNGYRPIKVTINNVPAGPTTSDRDFRIRLTPHGYYGDEGNVQVEAFVEMPEGTSAGTAWVAVPQVDGWNYVDIEVREGGRRIEELSENTVDFSGNGGRGPSGYGEAMPSVLFIDSDTPDFAYRQRLQRGAIGTPMPTYDLPDLRIWNAIAPNINDRYGNRSTIQSVDDSAEVMRATDTDSLNLANQMPKVEILNFDQLPDHWLHYTCLDLIVISLDDARLLAKQQPKQWAAIVEWTRSGPSLIVTGMGEKFERLNELNKLAGFLPEAPAAGQLPEHGGWATARDEFAYGRVNAVEKILEADNGNNYSIQGNDGSTVRNNPLLSVDGKKPPFAIRPLGLGRVAAMAKAEPLAPRSHDMAWLLNQLESRNWTSYQRHGISFARQNGDFMTFLVEGTGKVPVLSFLVLITLFVIIIGPVNYMLLKHWRRLYVLLVTVPAGAAIVTISLFSYALLSDGLGVRLRARSYTRLDQRDGQSFIWARQSYYAGLAPSGGLRFPTNTAVYPIEERPTNRSSGRRRELAWTDDHQQLRSGYISSRQTAQYLVLSGGKSERKLVVKGAAGAGAPPKVVNQLGAPIKHLALRDKDGNYYHLEDLAADEEKPLRVPTDIKKKDLSPAEKYAIALKPFSELYNERRPTMPIGYQTNEYGGGLLGFSQGGFRGYMYDPYNRNLPTPTFGTSILERELLRTATNSSSQLEPGSYVALLEHSPDMPVGYPKTQERGSFHILEGRW